jgi:hypothetical protein
MDKKVVGLASVLAISPLAAAHGAVPAQPTARANAYAELLSPIPNAAEALKAANAAAPEKTAAKIELAQYNGAYHHHHHHHWRRYYHHHHHHHHHHWQ